MKPVETTCKSVQRFLERHRIPTLNLAGILENEPQVQVFVDDEAEPKGLFVKGPWFRYVHTEDEGFLEALFAELERKAGFYPFSGVWKPLADRIKQRYTLVWDAPCDLYVLPEGGQVQPRPGSPATRVRLEDAELIDAHYAYRHAHSLEKIRNCIAQRPSSAVYVDGKAVCWLLVHEDNSLGIMYTLEEHRRKGYALDVSLDLVDQQLKAGKTPFLQIRDDNAMSPGLALKCGFVPCGKCDWFGVMVGMPAELVEGGEAFRTRAREAGWPVPDGTGLFRFLYTLPPGDTEANPVVEIPEETWLRDHAPLTAVVERLRGRLRFVGEAGGASAAFLTDDDDGFELLACSSLESAFLERVLLRAKAMRLGTGFVHATPAERTAFEACGFRLMA